MKDIKSEIAEKHNVVLSEDDPLFIMESMIESLNESTKTSQALLIENFKEDMAEIIAKMLSDSLVKSETIINTSTSASKTAIDSQVRTSLSKYIQDFEGILNKDQSTWSNYKRLLVASTAINILLTTAIIILSIFY